MQDSLRINTDGNIKQQLAALDKKIKSCRICLDCPKYLPALTIEPRPICISSDKAQIAVAGQAPGLKVFETGIPFNDASGNRLRQWLDVSPQYFYNKDNFAIIPMGFCFPGYDNKGSDLPPRKECQQQWHAQLFSLMPQIKVVLAIGQYAQKWHIKQGLGKNLTETVSNWRDILRIKQPMGYHVFPLPHPSWRNTSWIKKNPWFSDELLPILRKIIKNKNGNLL
ncbi:MULTISPECIES: uracil-DNA glycosylase family protein [unclassified Bartonella]|uniref:uracil-DNA glycosylase family protein n=1 Tax=unclassified Bartonella TaxID=2645622 RepID=UPI0015FC08C7|nr:MULTISPECIES: uracil-DNA glycosylase family protein [unclassified Bartonella]UXN07655.1 uracil-DNA glycosylase family protein [Bartonella sp. HY761]